MKRILLLTFVFSFSALLCIGQSVADRKNERIGLSLQELYDNGYISEEELLASKETNTTDPTGGFQRGVDAECSDGFMSPDPTYTLVPRNDDGSLYIPDMGFAFSFCGSTYTDCYINTNGNVSFTQGVAQFSPDGFPYAVPMIAPFWADVDTRNTACGQAVYKLFGNYMIVTWEDVGWFSMNCSPLNTFQLIISDGTAPIIGIGNNIQFRYGDMNWTTGTASGGGPFGGSAATVGYNSGDNINFEQVGRFNLDGNSYDGPFGANDGVDWLDNQCFVFDSGTGSVELACVDISRALDANCMAIITPEDVSNVTINGCAAAEVTLDISTFGCNDVGINTVTITVDDGSGPVTCTADVTITEGACSVIALNPVGPFCDSEPSVFLTASPPGGTWSGNAPGGVFDPSTGPGTYNIVYTNTLACPPTATITIEVYDSPEAIISPDPASYCEEDEFIEITVVANGGDGNYTFDWDTPAGPMSGDLIFGFDEGQYTVTVTDGNGCEDISDIVVIMNPTPLVVLADPGPICEELFFLTLIATPSGGVWGGPGIAPNGDLFPSTMGPGIYNFTYIYTDNFGCTGGEAIEIEIVQGPVAVAFNTGPYCEGALIQLIGDSTEPGSLYFWTGPNGYLSIEQNPSDPTEPGFYILQVTSPSGCVSMDAITEVTLAPGPDADASNTGPYCANQLIELFASTSVPGGFNTYSWTGPNGYTSTEEVPLDATEPGFYSVIINVDGCDSPEAFTEVIIALAPDALAFNTGPYCPDQVIELFSTTGTPGNTISYEWTGPNGYISFDQNPSDATAPGFYDVQIIVDGCAAELQNTEVVLNQITPPVIVGDAVYCEGENTLLDAGGGYSGYLWSNGDVSQTTTITEPGNYSIFVIDLAGCTAETFIVIDENPPPQPFISGASTFCAGSSSTLDAGGGYSVYVWSTGTGTQNITVNLPGDYDVTVTDANGCTGETSITVTENDSLLPAIAGLPEYCEGESTMLDAGVFDTYSWTGGAVSQTITATAPGTYSVTVFDASGCTGETAIVVTENALPIVNVTGLAVLCEDGNTLLGTDETFATYSWSDGTSGENITVAVSGTYSVTVTNAGGCIAENSIDVTVNPLPIPTITGVASFCEGNSTIIDAGAGYAIYLWSEGSGTQTIEVVAGGIYTVTVTDNNNCTAEAMITIIENTSLSPQIAGVLSFCEGASSELDAGAGYETYEWSQGGNGQTIIADASGEYSVIVTDENGCSGEVAIMITENTLPQLNIDGITAICDGESTELSADGTFVVYDWSDGTAGESISVDASGTYTLQVIDDNGCTAEASVNVALNANPEPVIAGSTTFCVGSSSVLDAGTGYETYSWSNSSVEQTIEVTTENTFTVTVTNASGCSGEAEFMVEESSSLNPVISGDLSFCEGGNSLLNAGTGFETYAWSTGDDTQTLEVVGAGSYDVTVSDASGCTGETSIQISENNNPTIAVLGNSPACEGESITLDAGAGFVDYLWSDQSLNQDLTVTVSGTYSVTVTDANNCTAEQTIEAVVNENPEPLILGVTVFCTGSEITLALNETYATYEWSEGSDTESIMVNTGGDYSVIVSLDSGCTAEAAISVTENENLEPTIAGELSFCEGTFTTLTAPSGFTYEWSNNMNTQEIIVSTTGQYNVLVTDAIGCTGTVEVAVVSNGLPEPVIGGSTTFCIGTSTTLDAGDYASYLWSDGTTTTQTLEVSTASSYTVLVTDVNGCSAEAQIDVTESISLNPAISGDLSLCDGGISTLDAGAGFENYVWSTGGVTQSISTNIAGDYTVTVSDASGCTGDGTVAVVINTNPVVSIGGLTTFCGDENSLLDAGVGYAEYLWSNGATTQTVEAMTSGNYGVIITDDNGCTAETSLDIVQNQNPDPSILGPSSFCSGNATSLSVDGNYAIYQWSTGAVTPTIDLTTGMDVSVLVVDANGCTGEASITVTENTELIPIVGGDLSFCDGENTLLDAGAGWETYEWSTGDNTPSITVLAEGNYEVIVYDISGCSGSATVNVATNSNPEPIIAGSTTFCTGNSTTLDAGTYASWNWSTGDIGQSISTSQAGDYMVTVTDTNGCSAIGSTTITESTSLNPVISGVPAFCEGETTSLDVGIGFAEYAWSTGSVEQMLEVNTTGDYSVTVTDAGGCTGETIIAVNVVNLPGAILQDNAEICNTELSGSFLDLYGLVLSGDANGTWEDTDGSGASGLFNNINFDGVTAGTYNFVYTTNSAITPCPELSYPITVTVIDCTCGGATFLPTTPLCNSGGQLDLNSTISTIEPGVWSIIASPIGTNPAMLTGSDFDAAGSDAGEYIIQYEFTNPQALNCPDIFTEVITVDQEVNAGVANGPTDLCTDESTLLSLADLVTDEDTNGMWTEVSANPSQGAAFDAGSGNFNTNNQMPGTYTFQYEVTAGPACPAQNVAVDIVINEQPMAIAGDPIELTCGEPMNALNAAGSSAGAAYQITWDGLGLVIDGNENTLTPTVSASGPYELVITNVLTGCTASDIVVVTESADVPIALAGLNQELTCDNTTTTLQPGQNYDVGYVIEWTGPGINSTNVNDPTPEVDQIGTYSLVVTYLSNGCTSSPDEVEVLPNNLPPELVVNTPLSSLDCNTEEVDLIISAPGAAMIYEWTDVDGNVLGSDATLSNITEDGDYTVLVTNTETGCTATDVLTVVNNVSYPTVNANPPTMLDCNILTTELDGTGSQTGADIVYNWTGTGLSGAADNIMSEASSPGIYTIVVTNTSNGCSSDFSIIVEQDIEAPTAIIGMPEELDCQVEEVSLNGAGSSSGGNFTYQWLDSSDIELGTTLEVTVGTSGSYNLIVVNNNNGCTAVANTIVSQNEDLPEAAIYELDMPNCYGENSGVLIISGVEGGTAPYVYSFDGSTYANDNFYPELTAGDYELSLEDANGCEWSTLITITEPDPIVFGLEGEVELSLGDSALITANVNLSPDEIESFVWQTAYDYDCQTEDCSTISIQTVSSGYVAAEITDINGCSAEARIRVDVDIDRKVFIPSAFSPNDDLTNDIFMIYGDSAQIKQINYLYIYNRWGESIFEQTIFDPNKKEHGWNGSFRGNMMNPGVFVYMVEIEFIDGYIGFYKGDVTLFR
ncbi:MAG: gliding motility-associated-like protein [Patescibacteria group bacterium]|jgi:gliding motility-associated-like protein